MECLAYQVTVAMYSEDLEAVHRLWKKSQVFYILNRINPKGPDRVKNSPLLCGQYTVYRLVLEVTYLLRASMYHAITAETTGFLGTVILNLQRSVDDSFGGRDIGCQTIQQRVFSDIYHLYIGAFRVCVNALREPSEQLRKETDSIVSENLTRFVNIPIIDMCYSAITWPLQVLACANRDEPNFQRAEGHITVIMMLLDLGHKERLEMILKRLMTMKRQVANDDALASSLSRFLTPGLSLLTRPGGVLS